MFDYILFTPHKINYESSMGKAIDIKGKRFGFWVAIESAEKNKNGQTQWLCQCECGTKRAVTTNSLRTGNSTSCGCNKCPDLTKEKFEYLLVLNLDISQNKDRRYWKCLCSCGKIITATTYQLRNGKITSCGCKSIGNVFLFNIQKLDIAS